MERTDNLLYEITKGGGGESITAKRLYITLHSEHIDSEANQADFQWNFLPSMLRTKV